MRIFRTVAVAAAMVLCASAANAGPRIVLHMGLGGALFGGPLHGLGEKLRACGADVQIRTWTDPQPGHFDVAIGHSAGTSTLDRVNASFKIALDPTARFYPRKPVTLSFYTDGIGIPLPHSPNIYVPHAGHVALPSVVEADVVRFVTGGRCK